MTQKLHPRSLRIKIVKSFILALLPVFVIVILTVEVLLVPAIINNTKEELSNTTRLLTSSIRAGAAVAIHNHLRAIAELNLEIARHHISLADQGLLSYEEATDRLKSILLSQQVGSSGYLYCLNSEGSVVVHPNVELLNTNVSNFEFVRQQLKYRQGYIEYDWKNPGELEARPKALYMVYFEPLDWIISASSYRSEFRELLNPADFREAVLSLRFGESGYAYLLDQNGETLIHPKLSNFNIFEQSEMSSDFAREMFEKENGTLEYEWRNPDELASRKKIAVFETISEYGWLVVSSSYLEEVMEPARVAQSIAYGSTFLLLLVAGLVSYFLSGRITRPVDEMIKRLDKNTKEGEHKSLPIFGDDELARLGNEINTYFDKVDTQNRELRHQEARYRNLFESSPDAILLLKGLTVIDCNPASYELFGGDTTSILGCSIVEFSPQTQPDGSDSRLLAEKNILATHKLGIYTYEWVHKDAFGETFDAEVRIKPFGKDGGKLISLAFLRDITDRKKAENALRKSELKYRELLESANDAIFIAQGGKIVFTNSKTSLITGFDTKTLLSTPFSDYIHPDDLEMVLDRHKRRLNRDPDLPSTYSFRLITKQKTKLMVQLNTVLIDWNNTPATLNFLRDISDQIKMETIFQQAQKMEAIGTLAGGIAHDFNNLLMGIQGRVSLLSNSTDMPPSQKMHLLDIDEHIKSATGLTRQLLGFARGGKYDPKPIDLRELVTKISEMFGRTRKDVEMQLNMPETQVVVEVDKTQMEQVILNIYVNGWQAMPKGGLLQVYIDTVDLSEAFCRPYKNEAGKYACLKIADSGTGMDKSVCEKIFDPFFTTKDKTRGTGLGMASAYGIIQAHNGFIVIDSEIGVGSTFSIYLPVTNMPVFQIEPTDLAIVKGSETILLVDDEEMILEIGTALLETLGYQVIEAKGGERAIEVVTNRGKYIDLIILDMIMPGLDGGETFDRIRELENSIPIMLSSGYSIDGKAEKILQKGCSEFIQKPFSLEELSHKVRSAIEQQV